MPPLITSLQNERVKLAYGLQQRARTRRKERKIVLEGLRLVRDAVERGHKPVFVLYQPETADRDLIAMLDKRRVELLPVTTEVMSHLSDTEHPQGIMGVFPLPVPPLPRQAGRVLILDALRDPGNVGTILRTAAAAGVQAVILSPDSADPYNPKVLRSGMGAHFRVPIIEATWPEIAEYCQPLHVYVAAGNGDLRYDQVDWTDRWALIIGSEAHGAGRDSEQLASRHISIPMAADTESLNAVVAAGVILFESARQILA